MSAPTATLDPRFGDTTEALPWTDAAALLSEAELYWLTTVRVDGRPHVTPLVGVWLDEAFWFCTGAAEQKARNLEHSRTVAVTTGCNTWAAGTDLVLEGKVTRVTEPSLLQVAADAWFAKYGEVWRFTVDPVGGFTAEDGIAYVYRVQPSKVIAFEKAPHGQTTFRFDR